MADSSPGLVQVTTEYYCVICGKCRVDTSAEGARIIIHADVPHPDSLTFDEEDNPQ
jgi:hypothetical protein